MTLIITGRLRLPADSIEALAFGAVTVLNAALQSTGGLRMRACHTNRCPAGIATRRPHRCQRLKVGEGAPQPRSFLRASAELMQVIARTFGHDHLRGFCIDDLTTQDREMAHLTGIVHGRVSLD